MNLSDKDLNSLVSYAVMHKDLFDKLELSSVYEKLSCSHAREVAYAISLYRRGSKNLGVIAPSTLKTLKDVLMLAGVL